MDVNLMSSFIVDVKIKGCMFKFFCKKNEFICWKSEDSDEVTAYFYQDFLHFEISGQTITLLFTKEDNDTIFEHSFSF